MININIESAFYTKETEVLKDIKINIEKGEIVTLLGKSGCGKSTLLKIIASLHTKFIGTLDIDKSITIGYIPQNKCLLPWRTVYENIVMLKKIDSKVNVEQADTLIKRLGIFHLRNKFANRLSGGEYQRVVLGQTFFYEPSIILMDEPFSALDYETKCEIMNLFVSMQKEKNITTVFVTHNIDEADFMNGRIIQL